MESVNKCAKIQKMTLRKYGH